MCFQSFSWEFQSISIVNILLKLAGSIKSRYEHIKLDSLLISMQFELSKYGHDAISHKKRKESIPLSLLTFPWKCDYCISQVYCLRVRWIRRNRDTDWDLRWGRGLQAENFSPSSTFSSDQGGQVALDQKIPEQVRTSLGVAMSLSWKSIFVGCGGNFDGRRFPHQVVWCYSSPVPDVRADVGEGSTVQEASDFVEQGP